MAEKIKVVVVKPLEPPVVKEIDKGLQGMYNAIGNGCNMIQAVYPWEDMVALVCDEEGKLNERQIYNRALYDANGNPYDIIKGTFLIVGIDESDFCGIPDDLAKKYMEKFKMPEVWIL